MFAQRSAGILMHPTSLPSVGGIGDLGPAAYEFVDWLAAAKQTLWQVLPTGPAGWGDSPYSCTSAFAGNVLMISLERLAERGYLDWSQIQSSDRLGWPQSISRKCALASCRCCARPHAIFCAPPLESPRRSLRRILRRQPLVAR